MAEPVQQPRTPDQTPDKNPGDQAALPARVAPIVERRRVLELGKSVGRLEQSLERIEERLSSLPGELPDSVAKEWASLKSRAEKAVTKVESALGENSIPHATLESEIKQVNSSLTIVEGLLNPPASQDRPQIGLPSGSVIAYDPEDIAGIAALSGIIELAQNPEKVDSLLKKLGIEKLGDDESVGRALQRSMMESIQRQRGALPNLPAGSTSERQDQGEPIKPTAEGDFIGGPKKERLKK